MKKSILYKEQVVTKREASERAAHFLSCYWVLMAQPGCYFDFLNLQDNKEVLKAHGCKQMKVC